MWAEIDTTAAMQAHINRSMFILVNCINRAGAYTFPTPDALFFSNNDPASLPLTEGSGRAGSDTGGRITAKTDEGHKTSGQSAGRMDTNARTGPGNLLMNQPGTGQRAGVATDTAVNSGSG